MVPRCETNNKQLTQGENFLDLIPPPQPPPGNQYTITRKAVSDGGAIDRSPIQGDSPRNSAKIVKHREVFTSNYPTPDNIPTKETSGKTSGEMIPSTADWHQRTGGRRGKSQNFPPSGQPAPSQLVDRTAKPGPPNGATKGARVKGH